MIIHADMPCFRNYRVTLDKQEVTRPCYMADDVHGVVLLRFAGPQGQGFIYEHRTGLVKIIRLAESSVKVQGKS